MTRHAVVTGSTSGIGAATTRGLHSASLRVLVTGRDRQRGDALAAELSSPFVPSDLTGSPDALRAFAATATEALDRHGRSRVSSSWLLAGAVT